MSGFMPNYIYWTKHGERGVIMEEDDEEEGYDNNMIFCGFAEYSAFDDTAMGEAKEEVAAKEVELVYDLGQAILDAQRECERDKEKIQVRAHARGSQEIAIPDRRRGVKKLGTTLELLQ
jgi:hypothetical protein